MPIFELVAATSFLAVFGDFADFNGDFERLFGSTTSESASRLDGLDSLLVDLLLRSAAIE